MGFCVFILKIFTHPPCLFLAFSENEIKTVLVVCFGLSGSTSLPEIRKKEKEKKKSVKHVCTMLVQCQGVSLFSSS